MTRLAAVTLLALAPSVVALSQPPAPSPVETPHLTIAVSNPPRAVAPGARVSLRVDVTPKPNMHVYAPEQEDSIPVSLAVNESPDYVAQPPVFPPPEKFYFKPLDQTQLVYSKPFRIVQDVTVARTQAMRRHALAVDAALTITGTLRYQACDNTVCYAPKNVPVRWTVGLKVR